MMGEGVDVDEVADEDGWIKGEEGRKGDGGMKGRRRRRTGRSAVAGHFDI